jgi:membrane protein implicated in regulation of membrane protease activity
MEGLRTLYLVCALIGGTAIVVQTILLLVGGGDGDLDDGPDVHHDGSHSDVAFLKWLSIKGIVAFLTFFGLAGLATGSSPRPLQTLPVALAAGLAALFAVGWMMRALSRLQSSGTLDLGNAVGKTGRVHLRIPPARRGAGKVMVEVQGRLVECGAVTAANEIPTGTPVRVVAVSGDVLEVAAEG